MNAILEIVKIVAPIIVALVKAAHADKNECEHKEIAGQVVDQLRQHIEQPVNE